MKTISYLMGVVGFVSLAGLAEAAHIIDYQVAAATDGGINLYAITAKGATLVPGSPFYATNPAPPTFPDFPNLTPQFLQMDEQHEHVYAVYPATPFTQSMLAGWKITPRGASAGIRHVSTLAESGNHGHRPNALLIQADYELVYYGPAEGTFGEVVELYNRDGAFVNAFTGEAVAPLIQSLTSVVIAPTREYLYACLSTLNTTYQVTTQSVGLFNIKSGALLFSNSDPTFYSGTCTQ
jgi:hypothetical protein